MAPRETENNAYAKFWSDQQRVLWYVMIFSVVVNLQYTDTHTLVKNNKAVCKAPKKFECQLVTVYSFRESQLQCKFSFLNLRSVPSIFRVFILASIVSFMSLASFSREASIQSSWN